MSQPSFINVEPERQAVRRFALFEYGFRPFFLLAGCYAILAVPLWITIWRGSLGWQPAMAASVWHGHEMIFGFAVAALAGFMLTAVPNWTGAAAIRGPILMFLVALWAAGRVAAFLPWPGLFAALDLAFLPALALILGPGIIMRNGKRNGVLVGVLLLLAAINSAVHFDGWGFEPLSSSWALQVAIAVFALLIGLIGGRIVPAFTQGGMKMSGVPFIITGHKIIDGAAVLSLLANLLATLLQLPAEWAAAIALAAAIANGIRLLRWRGWRTLAVPLVWVLNLGYGWLVIGLFLTALGLLELVPGAMGLHALTAGSFATMILAVMSRAALGHTGRQLIAARPTAVAYVALTLAAGLRVAAPLVPDMQSALIDAASLFWAGAFLLFVLHYLPILISARPDGRPG